MVLATQSYAQFLNKHKTDDVAKTTHTRLYSEKDQIYPAKYHIPDSELDEFFKLYHERVVTMNANEFLTEKQNSDGTSPILVDLDLHYPSDVKERQYFGEHIESLIDLYNDKIDQMLEIPKNIKWEVFVLEKSKVNTDHKHKDKYTKDGIHLIIGIQMDHTLQQMLRNRVLEDIGDYFGDIPLVNSYHDVLDECISTGKTNWQVLYSKKPEHEAYKLTHHMSFEKDDEDEFIRDDITIQKPRIPLSLLKRCSARYKKNPKFKMRDSLREEYGEFEKNKQKRKAKKTAKKSKRRAKPVLSDISDISSPEELDNAIQEHIYSKDMKPDEIYLREIHEMAIALSEKYYDPYDKWRTVGLALHEADPSTDRMFLTWMKFSSKSDKFDFRDINLYLVDYWNKFDPEGGITFRSIYWFLKEDNEAMYKQIKKDSIQNHISQIIHGGGGRDRTTDHDIAELVYMFYKGDFICSSIKNDIWYSYGPKGWTETEKGVGLSVLLSTEIRGLMAKELSDRVEKVHDDDDNGCNAVQTISAILDKLMNHSKKANIMKECRELFYDKNFNDNLDENPYLMGCSNGVIDFKEKTFRQGRPEDYISQCTKITYTPLDEIKQDAEKSKYVGEIQNFMEQLFPVEELREYMWEHLASTLVGVNKNQTFNIYSGSGSNGKSVLIDFMRLVLGDYQGVAPVTIITCGRNKSGGTNTELVTLKGKRLAVMQEPSKGDRINDGMLKEITGGDTISVRGLYHSSMTNYVPQFRLVVCTNNLFDIKSNDDGTWRRIRLVEFMSKFTDNPVDDDPDKPYQFRKDKDLNANFKNWAPVMLSMLADIAFKEQGNVTDRDIVMQASNQYRNDQDDLSQFVTENICVSEGDKIKKGELSEHYKQWYEQQFGKRATNAKELYSYMDKRFGKFRPKKGWQNVKIVYDDSDDSDDEN